MKIIDFLQKYGKNKKLTKWEYLYKSWDNDSSLYYIVDWKILLEKDGKNIAIVWKNEISGEKSFFEWTWKPIDAVAYTDLEVFYITYEDFQKIDFSIQKDFLKELVLFVSNRVYLLNDVISSLWNINTKIIQENKEIDLNYFQEIFNFIDLKNICIYKLFDNDILPIFETKLDFDLHKKIKECTLSDLDIKNENNRIIVKVYNFIISLEWEKLKSDYIINNSLMHSIGSLKYLCLILEEQKNKNLEDFL